MSGLSTEQINKILYDNLETILPEMEFTLNTISGSTCKTSIYHYSTIDNKGNGNDARSVTYSESSRSHKVGIIYDNGADSPISIVDCYALRHYGNTTNGSSREWYKLVKEIFNLIGKRDLLPQGGSSTASDDFRDFPTAGDIICAELQKELLEGTSDKAEALRHYLIDDRGLTLGIIKNAKLGLITRDAISRLKKLDFSNTISEITEKEIIKGLEFNGNKTIGANNILAIPYIYNDHVHTFTTRRIDSIKDNKYLNAFSDVPCFAHITSNLEKITIVEGWLDAAPAQAIGLKEVVAAGTNRGNQNQIPDAISRDIKEFTLLLDNDAGGDNGTPKTAKNLHDAGKVVYIATYPEGIKDLGDFFKAKIKEHVIDEASSDKPEKGKLYTCDLNFDIKLANLLRADYQNEIIKRRRSYNTFYTEHILKEAIKETYLINGKTFDRITIDKDSINYVEKNSTELIRRKAKEELASHLSQVTEHVELQEIEYLVSKWEEALQVSSSNLWEDADKAGEDSRRIALIDCIKKAKASLEANDINAAYTMFKELIEKHPDTNMLKTYQRALRSFGDMANDEIDNRLGQITEGKHTPYIFSSGTAGSTEYLTINTGLTFIVANTGHGKTTFLDNLALYRSTRNLAIWKQSPDKGEITKLPKVIYCSLEVGEKKLVTSLLTTFVNDAECSDKPIATTRSFIRSKGKESYFRPDRREDGLTHKEYFMKQKDIFYSDYLNTKALTVIDEQFTVEQLAELIRLAKNKDAIDLVLIDYAQIIELLNTERSARTEQLKVICQILKNLSEELDIPIVLAAQFNRSACTLADLALNKIGESGSIEKIADTVIVLYNMKYIEAKSDADGKANARDCLKELKAVGITPPAKRNQSNKDNRGENLLTPYYNEKTSKGLIYAKILKRRDGTSEIGAVLAWNSKIKHILGNADLSIYDPEFMAAIGKDQQQCKKDVLDSETFIKEIVEGIYYAGLDTNGINKVFIDNDGNQVIGGKYESKLTYANGNETDAAQKSSKFWSEYIKKDMEKDDDKLELTDRQYYEKYGVFPDMQD